jgi:hypothetical protein
MNGTPFPEYTLFPPEGFSSSSSSILLSSFLSPQLEEELDQPPITIFDMPPLNKSNDGITETQTPESIDNATKVYEKIQKEIQEAEKEIQKKMMLSKLSKEIESYLQEYPDDTYDLTRYTLFEIDGIQSDIFIGKEGSDTYYYHFVAKNIEYEETNEDDEDTEDTDVILIEKNDFDTVLEVLRHIEKVKSTYTFLDFYLLSPKNKEIAKLHRSFLPLPPDKLCSVCYEPTIEYTMCRHPICLKCREKCITNKRKMCPVCRSTQLRLYPSELGKL